MKQFRMDVSAVARSYASDWTGVEEWRPIPTCPRYFVSNFGRVKSPLKLLKQSVDNNGYLQATIGGTTTKTHRAVALAFLGPRPAGLCINHKDGNKGNNHPSNLEYITVGENVRHAIAMGLYDPRILSKMNAGVGKKITWAQVVLIREAVMAGVARHFCAAAFGIHVMTVGEIVRHEVWLGPKQS